MTRRPADDWRDEWAETLAWIALASTLDGPTADAAYTTWARGVDLNLAAPYERDTFVTAMADAIDGAWHREAWHRYGVPGVEA